MRAPLKVTQTLRGHSSNSTPASKQTCTATNTPARNASEGVIIARPSCDPLAQPNGGISVPRSDGETTVRELAGYALRQAGIGAGGRQMANTLDAREQPRSVHDACFLIAAKMMHWLDGKIGRVRRPCLRRHDRRQRRGNAILEERVSEWGMVAARSSHHRSPGANDA